MGFPLISGRSDGKMFMTWVTCAAGAAVAVGVESMVSLSDGGSGL